MAFFLLSLIDVLLTFWLLVTSENLFYAVCYFLHTIVIYMPFSVRKLVMLRLHCFASDAKLCFASMFLSFTCRAAFLSFSC